MIIIMTPHAGLGMRDRGIGEAQVRRVFENPREVISVRYGGWRRFVRLMREG